MPKRFGVEGDLVEGASSIGADGNTGRAVPSIVTPEFVAAFGVYGPFQYTGIVGFTRWSKGGFIIFRDSIHFTGFGAAFTPATKSRYSEINRFILVKGKISEDFTEANS